MTRPILLTAGFFALRAFAQSATTYTDAKSGIDFLGYTDPTTGSQFGIALPETAGSDFIGQIVAPVNSTGGWAGLDLGGEMTDYLLIVAWPNGDDVVSSIRKASGYTSPPVVTGNYSLKSIPAGTWTNDTTFSYTFLCSGCITGGSDSFSYSTEDAVFGWAYSDDAITDKTSSSSALTYHSAGYGDFGAVLANAKSASYSTWAAMAVASNTTSGSTSGSATNSTTSTNTTATVANATYDYIVAGAGAAGLIVAERLVESGASVLLIERGGSSLASTGNNDTLSWNSSVTMYDVPGFDYYLTNMDAAYCTDTASQAGCLLGGGTMVNAMMYVKPQEKDFDDKWPVGWKWTDVATAADRLYERNPGQTYGSEDGIRYNDQAYDLLSQFFASQGYKSVDAIQQPNEKTNVYSHPPWSEQNGLRAGPVRNYLPLAQAKSNFKLMLNTKVLRAVRNSTTISGVEVEDSTGARVIYNVKTGGSVILAAGTMSTPRILFNSGIGPTAQIQTVANGTTGITLPPQSAWINLPVGSQIKDHVIFTLKFNTTTTLPAVTTSQITSPNETAIDLFAKGSGVLAESGQRLNWWTSVTTSDGTEIYLQGTCNGPSNNTIQMKVYLTHGLTSVGELGITADGATEFITQPWLTTDTDKEAATMAMDNLLAMTRQSNSTLTFYSSGNDGSITGTNLTGADLIASYVTGAHFVGTVKMGDKNDSTASVDTDTKVFGTDNLFVVDASIHPDLPTGNTQAIVMVAAEAAAAKILALKGETISGSAASAGSASGAATEIAGSTDIATSTEIATETMTASSGASETTEHGVPSSVSQYNGKSSPTPQSGNNKPQDQNQGKGRQTESSAPQRTVLAVSGAAESPKTVYVTVTRSGASDCAATPTPAANKRSTPVHVESRKRFLSKHAVARNHVAPDALENNEAVARRSKLEKATFLDDYTY